MTKDKVYCDNCEAELSTNEVIFGCEACAERAYDRHQEYLMETGGGPTLREQQLTAYKIKRGDFK